MTSTIAEMNPAITQLAAPLAQLMAIGLVVGFGVVLYVASLVTLVGVEFVNSAALATRSQALV